MVTLSWVTNSPLRKTSGAAWEALYPFDPALQPYLDDVNDIVQRLLAATLPGLGEPRLLNLRFTAKDHADVMSGTFKAAVKDGYRNVPQNYLDENRVRAAKLCDLLSEH